MFGNPDGTQALVFDILPKKKKDDTVVIVVFFSGRQTNNA